MFRGLNKIFENLFSNKSESPDKAGRKNRTGQKGSGREVSSRVANENGGRQAKGNAGRMSSGSLAKTESGNLSKDSGSQKKARLKRSGSHKKTGLKTSNGQAKAGAKSSSRQGGTCARASDNQGKTRSKPPIGQENKGAKVSNRQGKAGPVASDNQKMTGQKTSNRRMAGEKRKEASSAVKKNRHGIPLLSQKDVFFGVDLDIEGTGAPGVKGPSQPSGKKGGEALGAAAAFAPRKSTGKPAGVSGNKRQLKNGKNDIPVLSGQEDLYSLFSGPEVDAQIEKSGGRRPSGGAGSSETQGKGLPHRPAKNRHGLRVIDTDDDLLGLFETDEYDTIEQPPAKRKRPSSTEESFEDMLDRTMTGKGKKALLREKDDATGWHKPLTLKQRLKLYPEPQSQLDLHGYTAHKAEERAERYIRTESRRGTLTVRIIVGKGLHSEGPAVLPDVVEDRVVLLKKEKIVLSFKWENNTKSKSGAMIVYLADLDSKTLRI